MYVYLPRTMQTWDDEGGRLETEFILMAPPVAVAFGNELVQTHPAQAETGGDASKVPWAV